MKGVCIVSHYCTQENGIYSKCHHHLRCLTSFKKICFMLILLSLVVCVFIYHASSFASTTVYSSTPRIYVPTISTEVYRRRLRFKGTQRRLPRAIIIGARKCGTRALLEMMALHSYVQKNRAEMHFFDNDDNYMNGLEWYRKKMPYSFDNQVTIEKTPSYFVSPEAPFRIRAMDESMQLLLIVREPAHRVLSDYAQIMERKVLKGKPIVPLEQIIFNEDGEINENYYAIKVSQYFVHMIRWLRAFPLEQIHIVDGDKLVDFPFSEIQKVEQFLNLPPRFTPWNFYFNETKSFYCLRNETMQKCLAPTKGRKHPQVDSQTLSKLRKYFAPFNEHFYELVGRNFSWPTS